MPDPFAERKQKRISEVQDQLDQILAHLIAELSEDEIREWFEARLRWADDAFQDFLSRPQA